MFNNTHKGGDNMIRVKHRQGTSMWEKPTDGSSSWLEFWSKRARVNLPLRCPQCGSAMVEPVGAHVVKADYYDRSVYILPVCKSCNSESSDRPFLIDENLLVPVK